MAVRFGFFHEKISSLLKLIFIAKPGSQENDSLKFPSFAKLPTAQRLKGALH